MTMKASISDGLRSAQEMAYGGGRIIESVYFGATTGGGACSTSSANLTRRTDIYATRQSNTATMNDTARIHRFLATSWRARISRISRSNSSLIGVLLKASRPDSTSPSAQTGIPSIDRRPGPAARAGQAKGPTRAPQRTFLTKPADA